MTERTGTESSLIKLSDSNFRFEESEQDIRGKYVYDRDEDQIGSVEDLYVDEEVREVRFLIVDAGGFLGLGEKHFLIPIEAVTHVDEDGVTINRHREQVVGSPTFDPNGAPEADYQRGLYDYYGYPYPNWTGW